MPDIRSIVTVEKEIDGGCHTECLKVEAGQPVTKAIQQAMFLLEIVMDTLWPLTEDDAKAYAALVPAATAQALIRSADEAIDMALRAELKISKQAEVKSNG
ncbi:MAG: hypothetical protein V4764_02845 [Burkholderia sp.]